MEQTGIPGRIQVSSEMYELINTDYECESRGEIEVKGAGRVTTYFVNRKLLVKACA
jgi:adenylate cyclase